MIFQNQDKWKNAMAMNNMHHQAHTIQIKNSQPNQHMLNQAIASSGGTLTINSSVIGTHPAHIATSMVHTQLGPALQNHTLANNLTMPNIQNSAMMLPPLQGMQNAPQLGQQGVYDVHQHHAPTPIQAINGIGKNAEHLMYLSQAGILTPGANQFLQQGQNQLGLAPVAAVRNQVSYTNSKLCNFFIFNYFCKEYFQSYAAANCLFIYLFTYFIFKNEKKIFFYKYNL